jgi:hypothetical protein
MILLTDIDHTIANSFWRDSMIGTNSWDEYHAASKDDKPFKNVVNLINSLSNVGYEIIGITGRTEKFRKITTEWLIKYRVDVDSILMRPDNCFIKNADMKIQMVTEHFKGDFRRIHFLLDDNVDTILAFNNIGIPTLQIRNMK